jgi:integrase
MGCVYRRGQKYWIKYRHRGKSIAEATHSDKLEVAKRLLKMREGEIAQGKLPSICFEKVLFDELIEDFLTDYQINAKRTMKRAEGCAREVLREFAGIKAVEVSTARIKGYIGKRQADGVSNATINRELSAIKRAFNLAARCTPPKVAQVPYIPMLKENNVRKGFIEHEEYSGLLKELPDYLKPVLTFAYFTGWRKSEILGLKWIQVDMKDGIVRLEPGETKNNDGRTLYMEPELLEMMKGLQKCRQFGCSFVFNIAGNMIGDFRKSWKKACKAMGRPDLLFHDLRRSGVRNMVRAGIPERVAMTISGHKTRSVFDRYNIVSQDDLKEAARKRHEYCESQEAWLHSGYSRPQNGQRVTAIRP